MKKSTTLLVGLFSLTILSFSCQSVSAQGAAPVAPPKIAPKATQAPRLKPEDALRIAKAFCAKVGNVVTGPGETQFPTKPRFPSLVGSVNPRWSVTFKNQAYVELEDATGNIFFYYNDALNLLRSKMGDEPIPEGTVVERETVLRKANAALEATGSTSDLVFYGVIPNQSSSPPTIGGMSWNVVWQRSFHGLPFDDQRVNMTFVGLDPALLILNKDFSRPTPQSDTIRLSPTQASTGIAKFLATHLPAYLASRRDERAQQLAKELKGKPASFYSVKLQIEVRSPDKFWQEPKPEAFRIKPNLLRPSPAPPLPTRVVWSGQYRNGDWYCYVCLDASTGEVVGGAAGRMGHR